MECNGVLIVDDDDSIRAVLAEVLRNEGYKVTVAENGEGALDYLKICSRENFPGIILLDMMMPVMDGIRFLENYHFINHYPLAPVVVMSSNSSFTEEAVKIFSVAQFRKPLDLDELLEIVRIKCIGPQVPNKIVAEDCNKGA